MKEWMNNQGDRGRCLPAWLRGHWSVWEGEVVAVTRRKGITGIQIVDKLAELPKKSLGIAGEWECGMMSSGEGVRTPALLGKFLYFEQEMYSVVSSGNRNKTLTQGFTQQ